MADSVAGGSEAGWGHSMPQAVCVLPYAHDGQLPVPEPHHSAGWCALQLTTCFPPEQPHHRASRRLFWLWDTSEQSDNTIYRNYVQKCIFPLSCHYSYFSLLSCWIPLQVLWLYGNNITWIEAGAFSNLRVLEELDLGDNPSLRHLEGGAFRGLEKLQSLHMHRCKLATLPHDLFHKLYSLQFLYLQVKTTFTHTHLKDDQYVHSKMLDSNTWVWSRVCKITTFSCVVELI